MIEHVAQRPSWDCRICGKPWPCDPAREALSIELDKVQLAIYLWTVLEEACNDLPTLPASETFERFLAWTR